MAGGPGNPMGARALYLGNTVYRVHGTNAPETIRHAVSSGCFRLVNDEITDLHARAAVGAKVRSWCAITASIFDNVYSSGSDWKDGVVPFRMEVVVPDLESVELGF